MATNIKDKGLLIKILKNIVDYPTKSKYRNLNKQTLSNKLSSSKWMELLFSAGFYTSQNGKRLKLDGNDIEKVKELYLSLVTEYVEKSNDKNINILLPEIIELMRLGFTVNDAELAVTMSLDSYQTINNHDMDEVVQCLTNNGFNVDDSMNAIVSAKYDIKHALEILVDKTARSQEMKESFDTFTENKSVLEMKQSNNGEKEKQCDVLISMGFDKEASMEALNNIGTVKQLKEKKMRR
eukprot:284785_1